MNTKALIAVLVVLVAGGGVWYYMQNGMPAIQTADMRFGDDGDEGGSIKQDVRLIVGESIMGKWKSTEDPRFVREFKDFNETTLTGVAVDWYNDEEVARGTYIVYDMSHTPGGLVFSPEANATYVQIKISGSEAETINFKLTKLTPESLDLIYMERGGANSFTAVQ